MGKSLYIAEKPSVAQEFARALHVNCVRKDGYLESEDAVVTWCVGHLVTMSYPEVYDEKYKRWSLATLPFIPEEFKYEVIPSVKKQFQIVSGLLNRQDVDTHLCLYRLRAGGRIHLPSGGADGRCQRQGYAKESGSIRRRRRRSFTGSETAKDLSEYDNLAGSAYLRAKEDYLMGINFSRLLYAEIRKCHLKLSGNALYGDLRGPGYDLRAGHGGPPGMGDPEFCENALLPRGSYTEPRRWKGVCRENFGQFRAPTGTSPRSFTRKMDSRRRRMRRN